jgi:hypothetical protein
MFPLSSQLREAERALRKRYGIGIAVALLSTLCVVGCSISGHLPLAG